MGRSVLTRGDWARVDDLPPKRRSRPLAQGRQGVDRHVPAPPWAPSALLNRLTIAAFNEAWFRKAPAHRVGELQSINTFFYPLDLVSGWNRLYGARGFVQWQCVVPLGAEATLRRVVERLSAVRCPSFLSVLKRFGAANPGPLSFPMPGWTLTLDIPAGIGGLGDLLDGVDDEVVDAGGRLYLAKDARVRPALLPRMYPRLDEWRAVRDRLDPDGVLASDLSRRLGLT
jgi:decaprenylphospho-beta-D-ribofuranose 2-oxidase